MAISPKKTNPPLVVDTDTMFPFAITPQCLKPIRGWESEILQPDSRINRVQLHECPLLNLSRKTFREFAFKDPLSVGIAKGLDHAR
jgi:hypothetical protein